VTVTKSPRIQAARAAIAIASLACACAGKALRDGGGPGAAGSSGASALGSGGASSTGSGGSTGLSGASSTSAGGALSGGAGRPSAGGGAGAPARCGGELWGGAPAIIAEPYVVRSRIGRFLLDRGDVTLSGPGPTSASAAGDLAMAELDVLQAGTEPAAGLTRFFTAWAPELEEPSWWARLATHPESSLNELLTFSASSPGGPASGIATDRGVLTAKTSIDARGAWMLRTLLCVPLAVPPVNLEPEPPPPAGRTRREQHELSVGESVCKACHSLLDPLGSSLEHFDELGAYRELDNGLPIDSSGSYLSEGGDEFVFSSITDLAPQLGGSCDVARCLSRRLFEDALLSASVPGELTEQAVSRVLARFAERDFELRALIRAIVESPEFLAP
jgi:hypothetical protein